MSELTQAAVKAATAEAHYVRALQREFPHIAFADHTKHLLVLYEALQLGKIDSARLVDKRIEAIKLLADADARVADLQAEVAELRTAVDRETERCAQIVNSVARYNAALHAEKTEIGVASEAKMADGIRKVAEAIERAIRARPL